MCNGPGEPTFVLARALKERVEPVMVALAFGGRPAVPS